MILQCPVCTCAEPERLNIERLQYSIGEKRKDRIPDSENISVVTFEKWRFNCTQCGAEIHLPSTVTEDQIINYFSYSVPPIGKEYYDSEFN